MKKLYLIALLFLFLVACQAQNTTPAKTNTLASAPAAWSDIEHQDNPFIPPMAGFFASVDLTEPYHIKDGAQDLYRAWYAEYYNWKLLHWHPRMGNNGFSPWPPQLTNKGDAFQIDDMRFPIAETLATFVGDLIRFLENHKVDMDEKTVQEASQLIDRLS